MPEDYSLEVKAFEQLYARWEATVRPLKPQPGPQTEFYESKADITIGGGGFGGGKTYGIIIDPLRHVANPGFNAVFFRREMPQITNPGGLWDEAKKVYLPLKAESRMSPYDMTFPSGARITFSHMQRADDRLNWDGAQIPGIYFDQLEHFEESQFWYMQGRNRSVSGVVPYMKATCNPLPDSWLSKLLQWWWDKETGYAIPERSGVLRWFVQIAGENKWGNSKEELLNAYPGSQPLSLTFIRFPVQANAILLEKNPQYLSKLMNLPRVERERGLLGNWKIRLEAGEMFKRGIFEEHIRKAAPNNLTQFVRYWDKAFTVGGGAYTVGVLRALEPLGERDGIPMFNGWTLDVVRGQWGQDYRDKMILDIAKSDREKYGKVQTVLEREPGSQGRDSCEILIRKLIGFDVSDDPVKEDKTTRAGPLSSQHLAGNEYYLEADWNEEFISEHDSFPFGTFKDQVDASSGGFNWQMTQPIPRDWTTYEV